MLINVAVVVYLLAFGLMMMCDSDLMDDDKTYEYGENLVQMLNYFTYYCDHVHPGTWDLLRILFLCLDDWAYDYLSSFMTPLINFMARVSIASVSLQPFVRYDDDDVLIL
jgi:hypothetical protein